jgi:hypothetical protein
MLPLTPLLLPVALVLADPLAATASEPVAPPPAPAEPAPAPAPVEVIVTQTEPSPASTTTVVVEVRAPEPAPAPVVVVTPVPEPPPPTLSPPSPTWGPVRHMSPPSYDPGRIQQTMRAHRRSALGAFAVGSVGMGVALATQYFRARGLQHCATQSDPSHPEWCVESMNIALSRYGGLGMAMFVGGTAGAGVMLGNAAATRDVQLRGGTARQRTGLKLLGIAAIGAASAWMIGANWQLYQHETQCEDDPGCLLRYRPLRWAANDGAALGIAAGAGLLGYAIAYERQGKALARLRAAPSLGARHGGVAVAMEF